MGVVWMATWHTGGSGDAALAEGVGALRPAPTLEVLPVRLAHLCEVFVRKSTDADVALLLTRNVRKTEPGERKDAIEN